MSINGLVILRVIGLISWTTWLFLVWVAGLPFAHLFARGGVGWRNRIFRLWAKGTAKLFGMRVARYGPLPSPTFFLVTNHLSYMDIVALATQLDCVFIAKKEVAGWPLIGFLCRCMGTIFVDRTCRHDVRRVNELIEKRLRQKQSVVLFAEGTTSPGDSVLPFRSALLEPVARAQYPVAYATITYRTPVNCPPAHVAVCWWGEMKFMSHLLSLSGLKEFNAMLVFGHCPIHSDNRKELAKQLWKATQKLFIPVVRFENPWPPTIH